jgi:hypothetical protein
MLVRSQLFSLPRFNQNYKYIMTMVDHFSCFGWAWGLKDKTAEGVKDRLMATFNLFGRPKLLQSDNGKEFIARVRCFALFLFLIN